MALTQQAVICDQGVIDGDDVTAISYQPPIAEWDSGFMLFSRPHDAADSGGLLHLDCILNTDIAAGMQLARTHGVATCTPGGGWVPDCT